MPDTYHDKYILEGHTVVPASLMEWARWFETADRVVARTDVAEGIAVSTVFLGLNHQFVSGGLPLLFETMVFWEGGALDGEQERCATWTQAEHMHAAMLVRVQAAMAVETLAPCLPGSLCEVCLDAPAVVLEPAPWGGERSVCAACMGGQHGVTTG